jgi:hypothetical protein
MRVAELKATALAKLQTVKPDDATGSVESLTIKVVGSNEYLDEGEVMV